MRMLFYTVWLLLLTVLQPTLAREIEIWHIAPNLFLCFVVATGFFRGRMEGAVCGIIFGLVYDMLIGRMIGVNSLCYLYMGFGAGVLSERFFSGGKRTAVVLSVAIATIIAGLVYYLARLAVYGDIGFVTAIFRITLPEAMYNAGISFLLTFPILGFMKVLRIQRIS